MEKNIVRVVRKIRQRIYSPNFTRCVIDAMKRAGGRNKSYIIAMYAMVIERGRTSLNTKEHTGTRNN